MVGEMKRAQRTGLGRPRGDERGITVFVVMMTIVLLTGAGTWATYSAGLTNQASGYARAAAQAMYTSELGVVSASGYLGTPGIGVTHYEQALRDQARNEPDACFSAIDPKTDDADVPFCKSIPMNKLDAALALPLLDQSSAQGSLSPFAPTDVAGVEGDFVVEMTEPRPTTVPGENLGSYQRVTLTSYGFIRPAGSGSICGSLQNNATATMMGIRAHMIIGPIN